MPSPALELNRNCDRCYRELPPGVLECEQCHALVHGEELERLAHSAKALEEVDDLPHAREHWLMALELLPPESTQAIWIGNHVRKLELAEKFAPSPKPKHKWAARLGPLVPLAVALTKGKVFLSIFKLKFLLSLAAFMGFYWSVFGVKFGVGFAVLILIHEMGHFIDIKRRGLPADMPVFLPGFGAFVRWQALGVSSKTRAAVSLAGPLAGCGAAVVCVVLWWKTGDGLWAALARSGAWLNVLNLIPIWILDGGQAVLVMNKAERLLLLTVCLALWLILGESVFFLVAAGTVWRLFTKDMPPQPSRETSAYFVAVLASLGFIMWMMPGQGFGTR